MEGMHKICPFLNLFLWTLYLMVLMGYRRIKHYLVMLGVMLVLFGLYAKFVGIKTVYRGLRVDPSDTVERVLKGDDGCGGFVAFFYIGWLRDGARTPEMI